MDFDSCDDLPDIITSDYLGDVEFGENIDIDELRIRDESLGSRYCKVIYHEGKSLKKPKKLPENEPEPSPAVNTKNMEYIEKNIITVRNIIATQKNFDCQLLIAGGPQFRPVLFYASDEKRDPPEISLMKRMQKVPDYRNHFSDLVVQNIVENLRNEFPVYFNDPCLSSKLFCLKKDCVFEQGLGELLQSRYDQTDDWRKNKLADPDQQRWKDLSDRQLLGKSECRNKMTLIIELACILPGNVYSTVYITCQYCGSVFQTTLDSKTWEVVVKDVQCNIAFTTRTTHSEDSSTSLSTHVTPSRCVKAKDFYMVTPMMGAKGLVKKPTKPSSFLRVYMYVTCSPDAVIPRFLHGTYKSNFKVVKKKPSTKVNVKVVP